MNINSVPVSREYDGLPDGIEVLRDMLREAKMRLGRVQLGLDARQATLEMVKEDRGADPELPADEEKAAMVEALRAEYRLCEILPVAGHGQEQLRVREERPGQGRDREARGRPQGRDRGVRGRRRHIRPQARVRPGQRRCGGTARR